MQHSSTFIVGRKLWHEREGEFDLLPKIWRTKKTRNLTVSSLLSGAAIQIRTGDLILTKDALYLLSYSSVFRVPHCSDIISKEFRFVNTFFQKN